MMIGAMHGIENWDACGLLAGGLRDKRLRSTIFTHYFEFKRLYVRRAHFGNRGYYLNCPTRCRVPSQYDRHGI